MYNLLNPLSRFLVAAIFLMSGAGKIFGFNQTAGMMEAVGFPAPQFFLVGAILLELVGGLSVLLGFKTRFGAAALILFMIPATIIFHASGIADPANGQAQMIHTLKNLAIIGALVNILANGAGAFALDNFLARREKIQLKPQEV
jgi:putative oxidoreductase